MLIELAYPSLIAQHEARTPGMRLTTTNGLVNQISMGGWKDTLTNEHLIGATHMMRMQQPIASTVASLGPLVTKAPIPFAATIGVGLTFGGHVWSYHLNTEIRTNVAILTNRGFSSSDLHSTGGVVIDIRRAYVDKGTWDVEAPFGLAY